MITLVVGEVEYTPGHTVGLAHGLEDKTARPVSVGLDWRTCLDLASAIWAGESPMIQVENWQILGSTK